MLKWMTFFMTKLEFVFLFCDWESAGLLEMVDKLIAVKQFLNLLESFPVQSIDLVTC